MTGWRRALKPDKRPFIAAQYCDLRETGCLAFAHRKVTVSRRPFHRGTEARAWLIEFKVFVHTHAIFDRSPLSLRALWAYSPFIDCLKLLVGQTSVVASLGIGA